MWGYWTQALCHTAIFIICAQVLVHFRPKASYEKYLKMLVSAMILIQLIGPVSSFLAGSGERGMKERADRFEQDLENSMRESAAKFEERARQMEQKAAESLTERILWQQSGTVQQAGAPTEINREDLKVHETGQTPEGGKAHETGQTPEGGKEGETGQTPEGGKERETGQTPGSGDPQGNGKVQIKVKQVERISVGDE